MANQMRAPADDSIFSGGLAGILAASVFGGPVGAAIGIGTGLLSKRMHQSELDLLADDYDAVATYGGDIQAQIKGMQPFVDKYAPDPSYNEQLQSIASDALRSQDLAQHYDPEIRRAGLNQLTNTGARLDAFHNNLQTRTQGLIDERTAAEAKMGEHFMGEVESTQNKTRQLNADADQAQLLVNDDRTISHPQTKFALMKLLGMSQREADQDSATASIGLLGTGLSIDINDFNPSYSEAIQIIESQRATQIKANSDYIAQVVQMAQQNGFAFSANKDGSYNIHNIGSVVQQFSQVKAMGGAPPTPPPTIPGTDVPLPGTGPTPQARDAAHPSGGKYPTADNIANTVNNLPDALSKAAEDAAAATKEVFRRRGKQLTKGMRRPTN